MKNLRHARQQDSTGGRSRTRTRTFCLLVPRRAHAQMKGMAGCAKPLGNAPSDHCPRHASSSVATTPTCPLDSPHILLSIVSIDPRYKCCPVCCKAQKTYAHTGRLPHSRLERLTFASLKRVRVRRSTTELAGHTTEGFAPAHWSNKAVFA